MANPYNSQPRPKRFLPDVALDAPVWLQNWLIKAATAIQKSVLELESPERPTVFSGAALNGGALLQWGRVAKATGYRIYRNTAALFDTAIIVQELTGLANVRYYDASTDTGTTYYYWLQAVNSQWEPGRESEQISVVIP